MPYLALAVPEEKKKKTDRGGILSCSQGKDTETLCRFHALTSFIYFSLFLEMKRVLYFKCFPCFKDEAFQRIKSLLLVSTSLTLSCRDEYCERFNELEGNLHSN